MTVTAETTSSTRFPRATHPVRIGSPLRRMLARVRGTAPRGSVELRGMQDAFDCIFAPPGASR